MNANRTIRVIKREQRHHTATATTEMPAQKSSRADEASRKMKAIVAGWVRERQQHAAQYNRTFASLFQKA
ncbi:MAG TPA: hypothetical protein VF666_11505 [Pyrinomonadaceae bacterium]|jgi:hypothetical protein